MRFLAPPPRLTLSEWVEEHRVLVTGAEQGKLTVDRTPFMREILDCLVDRSVREAWFQKSAQVGWTESLLSVIGAMVHLDPSSIIVMLPTLDLAQSLSKDRLMPMIRNTKCLSPLLSEEKRNSNNTLLSKNFGNGATLSLVGANSPASLAMRAARGLLLDEVDRFPESAGEEGSPIEVLRKRTATFSNSFVFGGGTPTMANNSATELHFKRGDQRKYLVPCPLCSEHIELVWENLQSDPGKPDYASYRCQACGGMIDHASKPMMIRDERMGGGAYWHPTAKGEPGVRSYFIWAAYSPWVSWRQICDEFQGARRGGEHMMKVFFNTTLGRTFEVSGEAPAEGLLLARREPYTPLTLPETVKLVTAGCDVQDNRIELLTVAWGFGEESWIIQRQVIHGDPEKAHVLAQVKDCLLSTVYETEDGRPLSITAALIDSGGHKADPVYRLARPLARNRIYACKGSSVPGKPILSRISTLAGKRSLAHDTRGAKLAIVGTDTAKATIYSRLRLDEPGPGFVHLPTSADLHFIQQLTAEEQITERDKQGREKTAWRVKRYIDEEGKVVIHRNEVLDCFVYALAAVKLLPSLFAKRRQYRLEGKAAGKKEEAASKASGFRRRKPTRRRQSWMAMK